MAKVTKDSITDLQETFVGVLKDGLVGPSPKDFLAATAAFLKANSASLAEDDFDSARELKEALTHQRQLLKQRMSEPPSYEDRIQ
jgi:hypothetical protein